MKKTICLLSLCAGMLAGCSDSRDDDVTGEGSIRAVHAVAELGTVDFLIEETTLAILGFQETSGTTLFDDLEYEFHFDILLPGDSDATRLASTELSVNTETDYLFVLHGSLDDPQVLVWEQFGRDWAEELEEAEDDDTEVTVMEISFGHIAGNFGEVDVYLESPGTSPQAASPRVRVDYTDFELPLELTEGEYQLVLTPPDDPATILYASDPIDLAAAVSYLVILFDDGGRTTADFAVRLVGGGVGGELPDINATAAIRSFHAAFGTTALDLYSADDFTTPLVPNLAFGAAAGDIVLEDDTLDLNVTPAGDTGVFLAQRSFGLTAGSFHRLYLTGLPGDLNAVLVRDDRRSLATDGRITVFQGAARFQTVDLYLVNTDVDISLIGPTLSNVLFGTSSGYFTRDPDVYSLVLTEPDTKNIIAGPLEIDLQAGISYEVVAVDAADITAADLLLFELPSDD